MNPVLLPWLYYACLAVFAGAALWAWLAAPRAWRPAGWFLLALALAQALAASLVLGRPPLAGTYETAILLLLWLSALALLPCGDPEAQRRLAAWCWSCGAVLLALLLLPNGQRLYPDWYMYQYIWSRLFFSLRVASLALFLYAALAALASWGAVAVQRAALLRWSRNFLLVGTAVFLAGEFSGFTWRMQWLGDYWCWNANFLEATLYFLLVTAAAHLPPAWAAKPRLRATAQAIPGLLMTGLFMTHMLMEP
ncbi:MAG: hypothetical protein K9K66_16215 [Desulfarculaceae bacterium]|nr:hypothetical protein [Desulfarculaceae bacterium]MCF8071602.1 hypothetical protein [Desulfarculaceae bacterium]MCF8103201.1 hypothetical protein [Desulfarculaceae bacterium]MCF8114881.1 hypothetical protein [Desulfarculaceae bacterium]